MFDKQTDVPAHASRPRIFTALISAIKMCAPAYVHVHIIFFNT